MQLKFEIDVDMKVPVPNLSQLFRARICQEIVRQ